MTSVREGSRTLVPPANVSPHSRPAAPLVSRWWGTIRAAVQLTRPGDTSFAFIGTLLGAGLAGPDAGITLAAWPIALSNACLSAASMAVNDWHDVAEDAINRPDRPVPSGAIARPAALKLSMVLFAGGIAAAALGGPRFAAGAVAIVAASIAYTWFLKRVPLAGNALTALLSTYPLWCWVTTTDSLSRVYLGAIAGFFIGSAGREIVRTAGDARGDQAGGIITIATAWGARSALRLGSLVMLAGVSLALLATGGPGSSGYRLALIVTALTLMTAIAWLYAAPPALASRRLTLVARTMTVVLAAGVAWDLLLSWWVQR